MKRITSDALGQVNQSLGITGPGADPTELHDGEVFQILDVSASARRGRTMQGTGGIFTGMLRNVHTDAESLSTTIDPYAVGGVAGIAPFPEAVNATFDLWLLSAILRRNSGAGTLTAVLGLNYPFQGFGIDDSGVAVGGALLYPLCRWDTLIAEDALAIGLLTGSGVPEAKFGIRLPRGVDISFFSTSSLTVTFTCQMVMGMFPVTLGQDIAV